MQRPTGVNSGSSVRAAAARPRHRFHTDLISMMMNEFRDGLPGPDPSIAELVPGTGHGRSFSEAAELPELVKVPDDEAQGWKRGLTLPSYVLNTRPPPPHTNLNRFMPLSDEERAPVLPELFMPGFPKSSTTWLYKCMGAVWMPDSQAIGCGSLPEDWTAARCPKRFLLTAVSTSSKTDLRERKETFFFGGTQVKFWDGDFLELHGPDPRTGANANLPGLWPWWKAKHRQQVETKLHVDRLVDAARAGQVREGKFMLGDRLPQPQMRALKKEGEKSAWLVHKSRIDNMCTEPRFSRSCNMAIHVDLIEKVGGGATIEGVPPEVIAIARANCSSRARHAPRCSDYGTGRYRRGTPTIPGGGRNQCSHPACERIAHGMPQSWSGPCGWVPELDEKYGLTDVYCLRSVTPWATAKELNLSVVDFTPNYLCDPDAMRRIHSSTTEPRRLRFIVVMRDPVMRAFSEWSMFALGWNWDHVKNFTESMRVKLHVLRTCNRTLYENPLLIEKLPTDELGRYVQRCFLQGRAMMYPHLSMYAPCIIHALRYFERDQFLFLRYEDLMRMDAASIVRLVGRFTGLHVDDHLVATAVSEGKCSPYKDPKVIAAEAAAKAARARAHGKREGAAPREVAKPMSFSGQSPEAAEYLTGDTGIALERYFDPFNEMLARVIGPDFHWRQKDHWKRQLNATELQAARAALAARFKKRDENMRSTAISRATMMKKSREWALQKSHDHVGRRLRFFR